MRKAVSGIAEVFALGLLLPAVLLFSTQVLAQATPQKPNIVVIMGDDIGWSNFGVYNRGMMAGTTPNIDQVAAGGLMFQSYYAEASCTAGRANFITGELPVRTGLTTVGQAGSPLGIPDDAVTLATVLKSLGYETAQFGKNHLGDRNQFLPTVHGFDEFFGYLYHLDAMQDPFNPTYPPAVKDQVGPRNMIHSYATNVDDPTVQPRWGKIGKQKIEDAGPLPPHPIDGIKYNMETVDETFRDLAIGFMDKAKNDGKPFFVWLNPTRMHVYTHLSPHYESLKTPENGWSTEEAGMAQFDDVIGAVMKKLQDMGVADNTIVLITTDNGTENFTWPDGGNTPFAGGKGLGLEGGFRSPAILRWPGHVPAGKVDNSIISGLDWFPTLAAAAGYNGNIVEDLKNGKQIGDRSYKVHLDGYDQTNVITGKGPSARHEIYYFTESTLAAVRVDDYKYQFTEQPNGWFGNTVKLDWPLITNLRLDPYERMRFAGSLAYGWEFFGHEFWRFVYAQQKVQELAETALTFPPMQRGASFNLDEVKAQIEKAMKSGAAN